MRQTTTSGVAQLELEPVDGPRLDTIVLGSSDRCELGRSGDCPVVLPHSSVSRRHTSIIRAGGRWCVTDLDSSNGTYLNGVRLDHDEWLPLADGDLVRLGVWEFVVRVPESPVLSRAEPESAPVPVADSIARSGGSRSVDTHATRASIFLRLKDSEAHVRELGWQEFSDRYGSIIVGFARNAGLPAQDADDVLQDVLMGFFRVSAAFEYDPGRGRFRGYLKRVTLNAIRARWRRDRGRGARAVGDADELEIPADSDAMWDLQWTKQLLRRALDEVCPQFEPRTIEAFDLYGRRGLAVDAVAERLAMSAVSVRHAKSRVSRALREAVDRLRAAEG